MPLPRFHRLPADARAAILTVARAHFAREGKDAASFNQIIADAGISKTSAYHYFDGKDDLFSTVVADAAERTLAALGPWQQVPDADALWAQLAAGATRLLTHLREHPSDRSVLSGHRQADHDQGSWIPSLVGNGIRIGLIDPEPNAELMTAATISIFDTLDAWALSHPGEPDETVMNTLKLFLGRIWGVQLRQDSSTARRPRR